MTPIERLRLEYRLRLFFRYRWKWLVCRHHETYLSPGWTGVATHCKECHFTLAFQPHNVGAEGLKKYERPTVAETIHWLLTGERK